MNYEYKFMDNVLYGERTKLDLFDLKIPWKLENVEKVPTEDKIDLSIYLSHIYNQELLGVAAANIICTAINLKLGYKNQSKWIGSNKQIIASRLYIHNLARIIEYKSLDTKDEPTIESCLRVLLEYGYCDEFNFKYDSCNLGLLPPSKCLSSAFEFKFRYKKLSLDLNTFKGCLKSGHPIIMGIVIFDNLESQKKGLFVKPDTNYNKKLGTRVILIIGYDDTKQTFKFANCVGKDWCKNGCGFIMYNYALDGDFVGDVYAII